MISFKYPARLDTSIKTVDSYIAFQRCFWCWMVLTKKPETK